jgi:hypothetical protein
MLKLPFNIPLFRGSMRFATIRIVTAANLPLHELIESAVWVGRELLVSAFLCELAVCTDAQDAVGSLDG